MRLRSSARSVIAVAVIAACPHWSRAVVTTDGSLGAARTFNGSTLSIPASLGRQKGGNVFHSFSQFDINAGQSVIFTDTGKTAPVKNVLARVTGGQASQINGQLGTNIAGANLYLINPAGISFGHGSSLNVSGTFTATTADVVKLADGLTFAVDKSGDGLLTSAAPAGFGLLSARAGAITISDTTLAAPAVRLVGGSVGLERASVRTGGGQLSVAAVRSGEVTLDPASGDAVPMTTAVGGAIALSGSELNTTAAAGGRLDLYGGDFTADAASVLSARTEGNGIGGGLTLAVKRGCTFAGTQVDAGSYGQGSTGDLAISAATLALGPGTQVLANATTGVVGGGIVIRAGTLRIDGGSGTGFTGIKSGSASDGNGTVGSIAVTAGQFSLLNNGQINFARSGAGDGGGVSVRADSASLLNGGAIFTTAEGSGTGGDIRLTATRLNIDAGSNQPVGETLVGSGSVASGRAGNVRVTAGQITLDARDSGALTGMVSLADAGQSGATGAGGDVSVVARRLSVLGGASVFCAAQGPGAGGSVAVRAGTLKVDGSAAQQSLTAISSDSGPDGPVPSGHGGNMLVVADTLSLIDGGEITADAYGGGAAGTVDVNAGRLNIDGANDPNKNSGIKSESNAGGFGGTGPAGNVHVRAGTLSIRGGGTIDAATFGAGHAGRVTLHTDALSIDGGGTGLSTGVSSDAAAGSSGDGGAVSVTAGDVSLIDGGEIASGTFSSGDGGTVDVQARTLSINAHGGSDVTGIGSQAASTSTGSAGRVSVTAGTIDLLNGGAITSDTLARGDAGVVRVRADTLFIDGGGGGGGFTGVASNAGDKSSGSAGDVAVRAEALSVIDGGEITSGTFAAGNAGRVSVQAGQLTIDGKYDPDAITGIGSPANPGSSGRAGDVLVIARDIGVTGGGEIDTSTSANGAAGSVQVRADRITIAADQLSGLTGILSESDGPGSGAGGDVAVRAGVLNVLGYGQVDASTASVGRAGRVSVDAGTVNVDGQGLTTLPASIASRSVGSAGGDRLSVGGAAGDVRVHAGSLRLAGEGLVTSSTETTGKAGTVNVRTGRLSIDGRGTGNTVTAVSSESLFPATGAAGDVRVRATDVDIRQGELSVQTFNTGQGGSLRLVCDTLTTGASGFITANTFGDGNAGSLLVRAGRIDLAGDGVAQDGGIEAGSFGGDGGGRGRGGDVHVDADEVTLSQAADISALSTGHGVAGRVDLAATNLKLDSASSVGTSSRHSAAGDLVINAKQSIDLTGHSTLSTVSQQADSGNLSLVAGNRISLTDSTVTAQAGENGAKLTIDPLQVLLNRSTINGLANGQPVTVTVDPSALLLVSNESAILAENPVLPPDVDLTGALTRFVLPTFGGQVGLAQGCEEQSRRRNLSSFSAAERLGVPPVPGAGVSSGALEGVTP